MNWKEEYKKKVSTPVKAIADIHDGNCVVMGHAAAAPRIIQHALAEHCEDYNDVLIFHMTTLGENECLHPRCYGHFRHVSNFLSANSRDAVNHLEGDFFPAYFKDVPEMMATRYLAMWSYSKPHRPTKKAIARWACRATMRWPPSVWQRVSSSKPTS